MGFGLIFLTVENTTHGLDLPDFSDFIFFYVFINVLIFKG